MSPSAGSRLRRPGLVCLEIGSYRYGLTGKSRFWWEEYGMQRWSWRSKTSRDEDVVDIRPVDIREVELSRNQQNPSHEHHTDQTNIDPVSSPPFHLCFGVSEDLHTRAIDNRALCKGAGEG